MQTHKRLTEVALDKKRAAKISRLGAQDKGASGYLNHRIADRLENEADAIVAIDEPPITNMGEVCKPHIADLTNRYWLTNTLTDGNLINEEASITRTDLLIQPNIDISAMALDAAQTIKADNSLEKMLAHQLALTHEMVMKLGNAAMGEVQKIQHPTTHGKGLRQGDAIELQRLANSVARLQTSFQQGMLTLQKLRTGGNQTVTVQHVNISAGGQAVIGNVTGAGGKPEGQGGKNG
jgi:hypothetical protein